MARLVTVKQQLFKSHSTHLPRFEVLFVHNHLALTIVSKGESHLKHLLTFVAANQDTVLGKTEGDGLAYISGYEQQR